MTQYRIFDSLQDVVFVVDGQWNLHYANQAAAMLLEVSARRLQSGKPMIGFMEFAPNLQDETNLGEVDEPTQYREVRFTTSSGKDGWAQVSVQKDPDSGQEGGEAGSRWIIYLRDVSLEKTLHDKYRAELDQKEAVIEDLKKARAQLEDYSKNLEKMVEQRTAELREANQLLAAILDSLGQGILVFDAQGNTMPFHSKVCADILERAPDAKNVMDILRFNEKERDEFQRWTGAVFAEMLDFADLAGLGPSEYRHSRGRKISLNFNPMRSSGGGLVGLVMVATDRTDEFKAKQEAERERNFAKMVVQIAGHRPQFRAFAQEARSVLAQLADALVSEKPLVYEETARSLHTLKGGAASFSLSEIARVAHEAEQCLIDSHARGDHDGAATRQELAGMTRHMRSFLEEFLEANAFLYGGQIETVGRTAEIAVPLLADWLRKLHHPPSITEVRQEIFSRYIEEPAAKSFAHVDSVIQELSGRLGKKIQPLEIEGGDLRIIPENFSELFSNLIHVFRNAVDHGMETPERRVESGKSEVGRIRLRFSRLESDGRPWLRLEIEDDGGGIRPEVIRDRLRQLGREHKIVASDSDQIQVIFDDDFSTKTEVTDISGRGVGLPAVKAVAEKMGGQARVESRVGQGTRFVIEVPDARNLPLTGARSEAPALSRSA